MEINLDSAALTGTNTIKKNYARFAIYFIWIAASFVGIFLIRLYSGIQHSDLKNAFGISKSNLDEGLFQENKQSALTLAEPGNAFVFINVGKKYKITDFPYFENNDNDISDTEVNGKNKPVAADQLKPDIVIRKLNTPRTKQTTEDFSIKSVPE